MALRRVRGVAAVENRETGDGRVIAPGATTWVEPPTALRWAPEDRGGHDGAMQVGNVQSYTRAGDEIVYTAVLDDEIPEAAEMIRRMETGSGPNGHRFGVSIDPDDWAIEIIDTQPIESADEGVMMIASGAGPIPDFRVALRAAAGDPDPGDDGGDGEIIWTEDSGGIIQRTTRLRIRALTALDTPAEDGAYMELDDATAEEALVDEATPPAPAVAASSGPALIRGLFPAIPPAEWFEPHMDEPDGSLNIVASGDGAGRVFGYHAAWGTCHTGYTDRCVTPPREVDYTPFHTGQVETESGLLACGCLTWGIPHANLNASMIAAQDHYAHSDAMFARTATGQNEHGIWFAGALRASVTQDDVADLRALSMSGDWRWSVQSESLRLIASTAVVYPGFPVARRTAMAAAAPNLDRLAASVFMDGDRITAMTSAGVLAPLAAGGKAADCGCHDGPSDELRLLQTLEQRTRHLVPDAIAAAAARLSTR